MVTSTSVLAHFSDSDVASFTSFDKPDSHEDVLEHYGVKGMKWGVRKDRKKSGRGKFSSEKSNKSSGGNSTVQEIKKAVSKASGKFVTKVKQTNQKRQEAAKEASEKKESATPFDEALRKHKKQSSNTINKKYKHLTNDDLRALNERMRLEKEYDDLMSQRSAQNRTTRQKLAKWGADTTVSIASDLAKQQMRRYGEKILSEAISGPAPKPAKTINDEAVKRLMYKAGKQTLANSSVTRNHSTQNAVSARELIARYGGTTASSPSYKGRHRK